MKTTNIKPKQIILKGIELDQLKQAVVSRDNHTCRNPKCKSKKNLSIYYRWKINDGGSFVMSNMLTMCNDCIRKKEQPRSKMKPN